MAAGQRPYTAFNFDVRITLDGSSTPLCDAAFSECSGLELTAAVKTIRQGGENARAIHLAGPVSYGQLTLKRGMTDTFDLWDWFQRINTERHLRARCEVRLLRSDGRPTSASYVLTGCLPLKLRVPTLDAKEGALAIEEMQIAYETLALAAGGGGNG
jgi:phage tail-like protein